MTPRGSTNDTEEPPKFNRWAALSRVVVNLGGLGMLVRRAINLYRADGWTGLQRGVRLFSAMARRQSDVGNDYAAWARRYDTVTPEVRASLIQQCTLLTQRPLISVIMPVFNPQPRWLKAAIESVREQIYPHWELCIADDASTREDVREMLRHYQSVDPRIKVDFRERNGHISAASNSALDRAQGEWVALFDHDDQLTPHALYWIADAINRVPDAEIVYSDEDKITETGKRCAPHFKPDWNPELFLSYNFVCHLGAYKRSLLRLVQGFRLGLEGAQDYDLALRCVEQINPSQIVHVPRVLYHWRLHAESTATGSSSKPYALPAGARALSEHLTRMDIRGRIEERPNGTYRVLIDKTRPKPEVSIVLVDAGVRAQDVSHLRQVLDRTDYPIREIVMVTSDESIPDALSPPIPGVPIHVISKDERPLAMRLNEAVRAAKADYVVLMDSHVVPLCADWLDELMAALSRPRVGMVGPRVLDSDRRQLGSALILGLGGAVGVAHEGLLDGDTGYFHRAVLTQAVSALSSACVLIEKQLYEQLGELAASVPYPQSIVDLCLRSSAAGHRAVYVADALMGYTGTPAANTAGAPTTIDASVQDRCEQVIEDPAYNPNLGLDRVGGFTLAWPPRNARPSAEHASA